MNHNAGHYGIVQLFFKMANKTQQIYSKNL